MEHIKHPFPPLYNEESEILILGSFPSVKSRFYGFFYGHPQNRFWRVIAALTKEEIPTTIPEKKAMLERNHIALWDVIAECDIAGSSDASIRNVTPNRIDSIIASSKIKHIFANGNTAGTLYNKYIFPSTKIPITILPSTSPANAPYTPDRLIAFGSQILETR